MPFRLSSTRWSTSGRCLCDRGWARRLPRAVQSVSLKPMNMLSIAEIPEVRALNSRTSLIRIPDEINVPVTDRIRHLIDAPAMRRLTRISQLGMVSLVYPGATHNRFEHSLGAYRLALLYLAQLDNDPGFTAEVRTNEALAFIVAALMHDIGHWPFCHPIEDLRLPPIVHHESLARRYVETGPIATILADEFDLRPDDVLRLLTGAPGQPGSPCCVRCCQGPSTSTRWITCFAIACTRVSRTAGTLTGSG